MKPKRATVKQNRDLVRLIKALESIRAQSWPTASEQEDARDDPGLANRRLRSIYEAADRAITR